MSFTAVRVVFGLSAALVFAAYRFETLTTVAGTPPPAAVPAGGEAELTGPDAMDRFEILTRVIIGAGMAIQEGARTAREATDPPRAHRENAQAETSSLDALKARQALDLTDNGTAAQYPGTGSQLDQARTLAASTTRIEPLNGVATVARGSDRSRLVIDRDSDPIARLRTFAAENR